MAIKNLARYLLCMRSQYNKVNYILYEHKHNNPPLKKIPPKKIGTLMEREFSQTETLSASFRN